VTDIQPEIPLAPTSGGDNSASRGKRLAAFLIDWLILATLMGLLYEYLGLSPTQTADFNAVITELAEKLKALSSAEYWTLFAFPYVMFFVLHGFLLLNYGQTIGKRLMGIAIVTLDNQKPAFLPLILQRYLTQWALGMIPQLGLFLRVVDVTAIFREDKRCFHDLIAKTKVIDLRIPVAAPAPGQQSSIII
jgi:uncharacterized RDD family membrane protein YckC